MAQDLTKGNEFSVLLKFSIPYLFSCFLQTFYGLADLFIIGQFSGAQAISAVSIGSQLMHMLTVIIAGLAMGTTVCISRAIGAKNTKEAATSIGNSVLIFIGISAAATLLLLALSRNILTLIATPKEAFSETLAYCNICFLGIPFITAYNVISSFFRGTGDTKRPLYFVMIAGLFNIVLDYVFIGIFGWAAAGAALATIASQAVSVIISAIVFARTQRDLKIGRNDFRFQNKAASDILRIGVPIALQDGFIQVSFIVITAIANSRGLMVAAAVGIVEKIICFVFLVPSAMLHSVSAICAQNFGAGLKERSRKVLNYAVTICICFGAVVFITCQFFAEQFVAVFAHSEPEVIKLGGQYLRSYSSDCILAGIHFCFSGYFCALGRSIYSFIHNTVSILTMRIPGSYLAAVFYPATLFPMGIAAPLGSLLSDIICVFMYFKLKKELK